TKVPKRLSRASRISVFGPALGRSEEANVVMVRLQEATSNTVPPLLAPPPVVVPYRLPAPSRTKSLGPLPFVPSNDASVVMFRLRSEERRVGKECKASRPGNVVP